MFKVGMKVRITDDFTGNANVKGQTATITRKGGKPYDWAVLVDGLRDEMPVHESEIFPLLLHDIPMIPVEANEDWNTGKQLVDGPRQADYGHPLDNFHRIALIWTAILDRPITEEEVALCMIGVKISREVNKQKADNLDDIDGYVACYRLVQQEKDRRAKVGNE